MHLLANSFSVPPSLPQMSLFVNHEIRRIVENLRADLQSAISSILYRESRPFSLQIQESILKELSAARSLSLKEKLHDNSFTLHTSGPVVSLARAECLLTDSDVIPIEEANARDMIVVLSVYGHKVVSRLMDEIPMTVEMYLFGEKVPQLFRKAFGSVMDADLDYLLWEEPNLMSRRATLRERVKEMEKAERRLYLVGCMGIGGGGVRKERKRKRVWKEGRERGSEGESESEKREESKWEGSEEEIVKNGGVSVNGD